MPTARSTTHISLSGSAPSTIFLAFLFSSIVMGSFCTRSINAFCYRLVLSPLGSGSTKLPMQHHRGVSSLPGNPARQPRQFSRNNHAAMGGWLKNNDVYPYGRATFQNQRLRESLGGGQADFSTSETKNKYSLELFVPTPEDMEDIGGLLSVGSAGGDVILLDGDLGAGKTCFSRGFIRGRTGVVDERVTSPTYLLSNSYVIDEDIKIYHMDLYRLSGEEKDLVPLDLDNVFAKEISLIEWPSRLGNKKPSTRLEVTLTIDLTMNDEMDDIETKCRRMKLEPYGDRWVERLKFLVSEGYFEDLIVEDDLE